MKFLASTAGPILGLVIGLGAAAPAQAVAIAYGTSEYVTIRDCIAGPTSACDTISGVIQGEYGGSPGASSSSASTALATHGSAAGSVALSGSVGAPVLSAVATSLPGARTNTNSLALQRYTYTGSTATTRTFGGTLTYSQTLGGVYPDGIGGGIHAVIDIFTAAADTIEVGDTPESNFLALFSLGAVAGYTSLGSDIFDDDSSTAAGVGNLDVTVTLNPGDSVFVWVLLQTPAPNGSIVDSSSTLITGWDVTTDLVPAMVASVPVPTGLALAGLGLALLGAQRRRARSR